MVSGSSVQRAKQLIPDRNGLPRLVKASSHQSGTFILDKLAKDWG